MIEKNATHLLPSRMLCSILYQVVRTQEKALLPPKSLPAAKASAVQMCAFFLS